MSIVPRPRMTSDEFLAWAMQRPEGERWELVGGELVSMSPERSGHALVKARVWRALDDGIKAGGLGCTAYPDGMAVEIDDGTVYEPDALVRRGEPLDDDAVKIVDPVIDPLGIRLEITDLLHVMPGEAGKAAGVLCRLTGLRPGSICRNTMAGVAQLAEHRVVVPGVAGSNPVSRPNFRRP